MCHFVTLAVPRDSLPKCRASLPDQFVLQKARYAELVAPEDGQVMVSVTNGHCSCGMLPGEIESVDRTRQKYARKGWSAAKVERAVRDHRKSLARRTGDAVLFRDWLSKIAADRAVAVYLHWEPGELHPDRMHGVISPKAWQAGEAFIREGGWTIVSRAS